MQQAQDAYRKAEHEKDELARNNALAKGMLEAMEKTKGDLEQKLADAKTGSKAGFEHVRNKDMIVKKIIHQIAEEKRENARKMYEDQSVSIHVQTELQGLDLRLIVKRPDPYGLENIKIVIPRYH